VSFSSVAVRAANRLFADGLRRRRLAVIVDHERLGVGDGDADRSGPAVEFLWRQIGAALALGQSVHGKESGGWEQRPEAGDVLDWQGGGGVGEEPHARQEARGEITLTKDQRRHGWHQRPDGYVLVSDAIED